MNKSCMHCGCYHIEGSRCCFCSAPAQALSTDTLSALYVLWLQRQQADVVELERLYNLEDPTNE